MWEIIATIKEKTNLHMSSNGRRAGYWSAVVWCLTDSEERNYGAGNGRTTAPLYVLPTNTTTSSRTLQWPPFSLRLSLRSFNPNPNTDRNPPSSQSTRNFFRTKRNLPTSFIDPSPRCAVRSSSTKISHSLLKENNFSKWTANKIMRALVLLRKWYLPRC